MMSTTCALKCQNLCHVHNVYVLEYQSLCHVHSVCTEITVCVMFTVCVWKYQFVLICVMSTTWMYWNTRVCVMFHSVCTEIPVCVVFTVCVWKYQFVSRSQCVY